MAGQKRGYSSATSDSSTDAGKKAKHQVTVRTLKKWQRDLDCEHHTLLWFQCEKDELDRSLVATLWCDICRRMRTELGR